MLNPIAVLQKYTIKEILSILAEEIFLLSSRVRHHDADQYIQPDLAELSAIEEALCELGVEMIDYYVDVDDLKFFSSNLSFPTDYFGGPEGNFWDEKILEHYIAWRLLALGEFGSRQKKYVDIAACDSPWAYMLRSIEGINAYAIDLKLSDRYRHLDYYKEENATHTTFKNASVHGASLQCAFEMFQYNDDIKLLKELSRILAPGGKAVIAPFYMHSHYCSYSSPENWGRGYSDPAAKEYIEMNTRRVPSSRKYDPEQFSKRILSTIRQTGMTAKVSVLRNAKDISPNIYCHFILELSK